MVALGYPLVGPRICLVAEAEGTTGGLVPVVSYGSLLTLFSLLSGCNLKPAPTTSAREVFLRRPESGEDERRPLCFRSDVAAVTTTLEALVLAPAFRPLHRSKVIAYRHHLTKVVRHLSSGTSETKSRKCRMLCRVVLMSSGPGVAQRAVMEVASDGESFTVDEVVAHLGQEGNRSQRDSVRRAMRNLGASGAIVLETDYNGILSAQLYVAPVPKMKAPPKPKRSVSLKQRAIG